MYVPTPCTACDSRVLEQRDQWRRLQSLRRWICSAQPSATPLPARRAFPVRARLVLVAAASVICVHPACSPTSLVRLNALLFGRGKNSLTKINRDVLHVMQGSIKTPKLNNPVCGTCTLLFYLHPRSLSNVFFSSLTTFFVSAPFPTGAFLGSINLPVTVPNAEFASMGDISRQWGRLDA